MIKLQCGSRCVDSRDSDGGDISVSDTVHSEHSTVHCPSIKSHPRVSTVQFTKHEETYNVTVQCTVVCARALHCGRRTLVRPAESDGQSVI